jgi:hypothetical protein
MTSVMRGLGGVLGGLGVLWLLTATTLRALGGRSRWNLHPGRFLNGSAAARASQWWGC